MKLEIVSAIDAGRTRDNNEDAVLVDEPLALCVLADGMGGYNAGEVASEMAVQRVRARVAQGDGQPLDVDRLRETLVLAARDANAAVFEAAQTRPECAGMGTTLVAVQFGGGRVLVGHIGDSRAYRFRSGRLEQLTRDHSLLQEQLDAGLITPEEAARSMNRNLVTRALGVEPEVSLEIHDHEVRSGDLYLLCSDGLTDMLADSVIAELMRAGDQLTSLAAELVEAANSAGGRDNISLILIRAESAAGQPRAGWWPFRR